MVSVTGGEGVDWQYKVANILHSHSYSHSFTASVLVKSALKYQVKYQLEYYITSRQKFIRPAFRLRLLRLLLIQI